jgi:putative intracellular protease/amidase
LEKGRISTPSSVLEATHVCLLSRRFIVVADWLIIIALFDLADDNDLKSLIREVYEAGKIVAAICHGVIVFKDVKLSNGEYLVANSAVTGFSNEEEDKVGLTDVCPVLVETELAKMGAIFEKSEAAFKPHVTVAHAGRLITGQNPASAPGFAEAVKNSLLEASNAKTEL